MSGARDNILATAGRRRYVTHEVDDVGTIRFQSLTELERSQFEKLSDAEPEKARAFLICKTLVDEAGNRLFADEELPDLMRTDSRLTMVLGTLAVRHTSPTAETIEAALKN